MSLITCNVVKLRHSSNRFLTKTVKILWCGVPSETGGQRGLTNKRQSGESSRERVKLKQLWKVDFVATRIEKNVTLQDIWKVIFVVEWNVFSEL